MLQPSDKLEEQQNKVVTIARSGSCTLVSYRFLKILKLKKLLFKSLLVIEFLEIVLIFRIFCALDRSHEMQMLFDSSANPRHLTASAWFQLQRVS